MRLKNLASILAASSELVIGGYVKDEKGRTDFLPWAHGTQKEDMKRFRILTTNNIVVMGRNTWESFGGRVLPNRMNIVVTRNRRETDIDRPEDGIFFDEVSDIQQYLIDLCNTNPDKTVFVIGGKELYNQVSKIVGSLYLTIISTDHEHIEGMNRVEFTKEEFRDLSDGLKQYRVTAFEADKGNRSNFTFIDFSFNDEVRLEQQNRIQSAQDAEYLRLEKARLAKLEK